MKARIFANIPESSLERIVAENFEQQIIWKDDGKEFYLNGQLYDLVNTKQLNGKTVFFCINDTKEKHLLNEFAKVIKSENENGTGRNTGKHGVKFQQFEIISFAAQTEQASIPAKPAAFASYTASLISSILEINSPPPKRA